MTQGDSLMIQRELTGKPNDLLKVVLPAASRGDLDAVKSFVKADKQWVHAVGTRIGALVVGGCADGGRRSYRSAIALF